MRNKIKGIIFDVDGVLLFQGRVLPGAADTVNKLRDMGIVIRILTNSTQNSRESCAEKLSRAGVRIYPDEVITASYATALYLKKLRPESCWIMLDGAGLDEFQGFSQTQDQPDYVVIGDNRSKFDFEHLSRALRCLRSGSKLIVMISELLDTSQGALELNVGAWGGMLERASGVNATYLGKPNPYVFELTLKTMNLEKNQVCIVGDQVMTDIKGARNFGIGSILLTAGEFNEQDLGGRFQPDFTFNSVREVLTLFGK